MQETYRIKNIMDWWKQFNNIDIEVKTESSLLFIKLNDELLPHLLGLQYVNRKRGSYIGRRLYNYCYGKSDRELFELVKQNNLQMLQSVSDRVDTFQYFMEHLQDGKLVENTKEGTAIRSQHFIVEYKDSKILHLGLLNVGGEDALVDYGVIDKKLETYFTRSNDQYFSKTHQIENIQSIEKYNEQGELEPFSFCTEESKRIEKEIMTPHKKLFINHEEMTSLKDLIKEENEKSEKEEEGKELNEKEMTM